MPTETRHIAVLGSTGSIGTQTLSVIDHLNATGAARWEVHSFSGDCNIDLLAEQARRYTPRYVVCNPERTAELADKLSDVPTEVLTGSEALPRLATDPKADLVVLAIYGLAALPPLLAAAEAGKRIALASKEALVAAGSLVMEAVRRSGAEVLPLDSEHNALLQCLAGHERADIRQVILTASGGPFHGRSRAELAEVTLADALKHPNWDMGAAISLNSATLFNKGLELIEAHHLFGLGPERIDVLVHPQSRVHAIVELVDGHLMLCAATPDMRLPIQYALTYPHHAPAQPAGLDLTASALTFTQPDDTAFPALSACRSALEGPWWLPAALISANEALCAWFRDGRVPFLCIGDTLAVLAADHSSLHLNGLPQTPDAFPLIEQAVTGWLEAHQAPAQPTLVQPQRQSG